MSNTQDIRRALEKHLNAGTYSGITNSTDIAWENLQYNPAGKTVWLRPNFQISEIIPATADSGTTERWTGIFTIDCFAQENTATSTIDALADAIKSQFAKGTQLTENSKIINLRYSQKNGLLQDSPWVMCSVSITWYAYIT